MSNIIGIDLGTSTTLLAHLSNSGEPRIYKNKDNEDYTDSAVWFENENKVVIGNPAKQMLGVAEDDKVFIEYKRDMGDPSVVHTVYGKEWRPRNFSALVLKQIKEQFENNSGKIDAVIITIPANFTDEARVDTINAAKDAGFNLGDDALVNEPTAAAIYYVSTSPTKLRGKYLVYDFGGGTFDATILDVDGDDIRVLTSMGVQRLGGKDFDEKLSELIAQKYTEKTNKPFTNLADFQLTKWDIELKKKTLSTRDKVEVALKGGDAILRIEITRNEFNEAISTLITQAEIAVDTALSRAKINARDLSGVFLAGGSTLVPSVSQSVEKHLGIKPISRDPVGSVALGACMYAAIKNKGKLSGAAAIAIASKKVEDVTPHYFGVTFRERSTGRLRVETIIPKDRPAPCKEKKIFARGVSQGDSVHIQITQSPNEQTDPDFVTMIWTGELEGLPLVDSDTEIEVEYSYDSNGVMECNISDKLSGKRLIVNPLNKSSAQSSSPSTGGKVNIKDYTIE